MAKGGAAVNVLNLVRVSDLPLNTSGANGLLGEINLLLTKNNNDLDAKVLPPDVWPDSLA